MKFKKLSQLEDKYLGELGTPNRDRYEMELQLELIGGMVKKAREEQQLTQSQLGERIGVQKAQISKIENATKNATLGTILKVFEGLKAKVRISVELPETTQT